MVFAGGIGESELVWEGDWKKLPVQSDRLEFLSAGTTLPNKKAMTARQNARWGSKEQQLAEVIVR